jgi:calcium-dependent protein kinase|mmetsp:Transcript_350/g.480  ORF Transcript_350/g.480 Transcript_350/m.480 type:complete len:561 (-) Transcript_350:369-2051(-)
MCRTDIEAIDKSTTSHLEKVVEQVESRVGRIPLMGRYHTAPRCITDDYIVSENTVLGKGCAGSVYQAVGIADRKSKFAVKDFYFAKMKGIERSHLKGELATFLCTDHPHVVRLFDVYESEEKLSLVMECIDGGELFQRVTTKKKFSEVESADTMRQILLALNYLHTHGIVHRDLKLENFLYDAKGSNHLKLIDFGFSKFKAEGRRFRTTCGTLGYVAPEVLEENYGGQCDMWSAGVIAFILLSGTMPFYGNAEQKTRAIQTANYRMKPPLWDSISLQAKDFVQKLLEKDSQKRLDAKAALAHPWIARSAPRVQESKLGIDSEIVNALTAWKEAPKLHRAYMTLMAWNLSSEEHAKVRDYFLHLDRDQNGTISLSELQDLMVGRCNLDESVVFETMTSLDSRRDVEIHYSDFVAALMSQKIVEVEDHTVQTTFRKFDRSNRGFITTGDFKDIVGDEFDGVSSEELLLEADISIKDGSVDLAAFSDYVRKYSSDGATRTSSTQPIRSTALTHASHPRRQISPNGVTSSVVSSSAKSRYTADSERLQKQKAEKAAQQNCCSLM